MIDYSKIAAGIEFYTKHGFKFVDAPWIASQTATDITRPEGATNYPFEKGFLVASGEQSFFQLILDGKLEPGCYSCVTPCFRDDKLDRYHQRWFLKLELIDTQDVTTGRPLELAYLAKEFFNVYLDNTAVVPTQPLDKTLVPETGYDVISNGIELGSYGLRQHPLIGSWVYATGCAEPRLSTVVSDANNLKA